MSKNRLWLLAHQDDEVLGLHLFSNSASNHVVYLTDGVRIGSKYNSDKRIDEARMSWSEIDRRAELIFFGTDHSLKDGALRREINFFHLNELIAICQNRNINEIVTLQLEGGHQDHDVVSMLAEEICLRLSLDLITFPAYRALHKKYPFYAVMSSTHKSKEKFKLSMTLRFQIAKQAFIIMKNYKSQLTTWLGLGIFVILRYSVGKPTFIRHSKLWKNKQVIPTKFLYLNRNKDQGINYEGFRKEISYW
jgi:LmbE family N-acetylglucosaminyl deacetylase